MGVFFCIHNCTGVPRFRLGHTIGTPVPKNPVNKGGVDTSSLATPTMLTKPDEIGQMPMPSGFSRIRNL